MPPTKVKPKGKTPAKGAGKGLKKKIGPLPLFAWLGIAGVVIFFIYLRSRSASSSGTGVDSTATVTPTANLTPQQSASAGVDPGTGNSGFDPSLLNGLFPPSDYVSQSDLQSQLDGLGSELGSVIAGSTFYAPADMPMGNANGPAIPSAKPSTASTVKSTVTGATKSIITKLPNGATITTNPATGRKVEQAPGKSPYVIASGKGAPAPAKSAVDKIISVVTLKSGAKVTTYASGKKVEQAPGKSPYVIAKGK